MSGSKTGRPTIFDLVARTGISRGTISRAFNDQPGIKPETKELILRAAKEINYRPHGGARMMKLGRTNRWGILIPHLKNAYYSELVDALNWEAGKLGITLLIGISNSDKEKESQLIWQWTAGETDGLILDQSHYHDNPGMFEKLKARGIAMVFLHGKTAPGFDFVRPDLYDSVARVMRYYEDLGHERIGYAAQKFPDCRETARFQAYAASRKARGLSLDESLMVFGEDGVEGGRAAFHKWSKLADPPTAVFCGDDSLACGVLHAARLEGWQVPQDLSIVGVDDIAESARAGLSTIRTSREAVAKEICDLLEQRRVDFDKVPEIRSIPSELILRDSISKPRSRTKKTRLAAD